MFVCLPDDIAKIRQAKNASVAFGGLWSDVVTFSRKKTLPVTYRVAGTGKEKRLRNVRMNLRFTAANAREKLTEAEQDGCEAAAGNHQGDGNDDDDNAGKDALGKRLAEEGDTENDGYDRFHSAENGGRCGADVLHG